MKKSQSEIPFEAAMARLQEIVEKLEGGEAPLDESLTLFEEGAVLSQLCSRRLNEAEQKIRKISAVEKAEGNEK